MERSGCLCRLDELWRGNHVFGIVQIDASDDRHVGLQKQQIIVQPDCRILRAGAVFNVPTLVLIGDEKPRTVGAAIGVVDVQKQLERVFCRRCLAEQDRGNVALFNAGGFAVFLRPTGVAVGVDGQNGVVSGDRFRGGDGHALFICTELGIGGMLCIFLAALGADAIVDVVVFEVREAVAGVGQLIGKRSVFRAAAVGAAVSAGFADEPELVHVRAVVLTAGDKARVFLRKICARIDRGAGRGCGKRGGDHARGAKRRQVPASW